jgi:hypothetical protein
MTEGYDANNKKTPQGVANVEVILFNHLMQERWKEQIEQWKEETAQWKGFYFLLNGKPKGSTNLRIIAMSFVENL